MVKITWIIVLLTSKHFKMINRINELVGITQNGIWVRMRISHMFSILFFLFLKLNVIKGSLVVHGSQTLNLHFILVEGAHHQHDWWESQQTFNQTISPDLSTNLLPFFTLGPSPAFFLGGVPSCNSSINFKHYWWVLSNFETLVLKDSRRTRALRVPKHKAWGGGACITDGRPLLCKKF